MIIGQALALLGLLLMLWLHEGFRELFLMVVGFVLFRGAVLALPPFLWAMLVAVPSGRADATPGQGTWLLFGLWWAFVLYAAVTSLFG